MARLSRRPNICQMAVLLEFPEASVATLGFGFLGESELWSLKPLCVRQEPDPSKKMVGSEIWVRLGSQPARWDSSVFRINSDLMDSADINEIDEPYALGPWSSQPASAPWCVGLDYLDGCWQIW